MLLDEIMAVLRERYGKSLEEYPIPPPVFLSMRGEFIKFHLADGILAAQFPILETYSNPYGIMQGGMIAAAIDNTIGPLSMIVASPSVTREFQVKYNRPVHIQRDYIEVEAIWMGQEDRWLSFTAKVRDPEGHLIARAKARHWIVEE